MLLCPVLCALLHKLHIVIVIVILKLFYFTMKLFHFNMEPIF